MVNGHFIGFAVVILPDGISSNLWVPGEVVVLVTTETDFRVDELNRVKVIAGNGVSDLKVYGGS
jgi:archaellum component FlaG (FlaF/FlaG flagellin family)